MGSWEIEWRSKGSLSTAAHKKIQVDFLWCIGMTGVVFVLVVVGSDGEDEDERHFEALKRISNNETIRELQISFSI